MQCTSGLYIKYRVLVLTMNISGRSLKNITKVEIHKNYFSFSFEGQRVYGLFIARLTLLRHQSLGLQMFRFTIATVSIFLPSYLKCVRLEVRLPNSILGGQAWAVLQVEACNLCQPPLTFYSSSLLAHFSFFHLAKTR
jgi:hypothetical protein